MMNINTFSFDYNEHNSAEYDLVIGGISISNDIPLGLSREIMAGSLNRHRSTVHHMGTQWSDVLQFELSFVKSPCEFPNQADMIFTEYEINEIAAWLTSPDYPMLLHMWDDDLERFTRYDYFGLFSDLQPQIFNGDIIGLNCTFRTNSPFAWTEEIIKTFDVYNNPDEISIIVDSAERRRELKPIIQIVAESSTTFNMISNTDGDKTLTLAIPANTTVILDCQKYLIKDGEDNGLSFEDLGVTDLSTFYWPKLYHGENIFTVSGNAELSIIWREPRKVGAY